MSGEVPVPWSDCKVAFGFDGTDGVISELVELANAGRAPLPAGWKLIEVDYVGARCVVVFRIDGVPRVEDGHAVAILFEKLKGARSSKAKWSPKPSTPKPSTVAVLEEMIFTEGWRAEVGKRMGRAVRRA